MKKEYLTLEDHKTIAIKLADAMQNYHDVYKILEKEYTKTNPVMKSLLKIILTGSNKNHDNIKNILDNESYKLMNEEEFKKYGFFYYSVSGRDLIRKEMKDNLITDKL